VDLTASPLFQILKKVCVEEQSPELFKVDLIDLKAPQATHDPHEVLKIYHQVMLQPESAVAAEDVLPPLPSAAEARDEEMRDEQPAEGEAVQQDAVQEPVQEPTPGFQDPDQQMAETKEDKKEEEKVGQQPASTTGDSAPVNQLPSIPPVVGMETG